MAPWVKALTMKLESPSSNPSWTHFGRWKDNPYKLSFDLFNELTQQAYTQTCTPTLNIIVHKFFREKKR